VDKLALLFALVLLLAPQLADAAPPSDPVSSGQPITLTASPTLDHTIETRLETIYAELPKLEEVEVEVEAGVVHLRGQVFELEASNEAEAIARRVEGVVAVDSDIEQIRSLGRRLRPLLDDLETRLVEFLAFLPLLLVGLLLITASWLIARLLARWRGLYRKVTPNAFVREIAGQVVRAGIIVLGMVLALELMGATTLIGAVLGTAGVVGLAVGFAFKDTAENYIASILMSVRKPFEPNDLIGIEGHTGRVVRLTSRATTLLTLDGNHVRVPNAAVFKATIINYTRNPERRFSFELGVAVEAELAKVQELAIETLRAMPGVLDQPPPSCYVEGFGDSAMLVSIGGWIDQRQADWFKVGSEARRRIKAAFDQAGIEVPEPIFRVRTRALDRDLAPPPVHAEQVEPSEATDLSPDQHIVRQVAEERAETGETDLLLPDAPIE
jgi:small conductance mechanosensitive channel